MGEILNFDVGCRRCSNLVQVDKNTYTCIARLHIDDSPVNPIVDGKHTEDWCVCEGEDYKRMSNNYSKMS